MQRWRRKGGPAACRQLPQCSDRQMVLRNRPAVAGAVGAAPGVTQLGVIGAAAASFGRRATALAETACRLEDADLKGKTERAGRLAARRGCAPVGRRCASGNKGRADEAGPNKERARPKEETPSTGGHGVRSPACRGAAGPARGGPRRPQRMAPGIGREDAPRKSAREVAMRRDGTRGLVGATGIEPVTPTMST